MLTVSPIQFTQEQARTLTGVTTETIRHWRKAISYLERKPGKAARFTFADVVGLAVTQELTNGLGVRITNICAGVEALFQQLAQVAPTMLESGIALVTAETAAIVRGEELNGPGLDQSSLVIPLRPLVLRIREHMMPMAPGPEQASLPFPPQVARSGA